MADVSSGRANIKRGGRRQNKCDGETSPNRAAADKNASLFISFLVGMTDSSHLRLRATVSVVWSDPMNMFPLPLPLLPLNRKKRSKEKTPKKEPRALAHLFPYRLLSLVYLH